ncbi:MAG: precorrin-6A/cobalt-precorrin-6A reductase, partial [Pseudonocardia sp.]|nr:precorrin-6A/cobalt-precorrin-6A reductase [Pseudonocardia sp.]
MNVLLLGGTAEARRLAAAAGARPEIALTSSLAGAVAVPLLPEGDVRIGG